MTEVQSHYQFSAILYARAARGVIRMIERSFSDLLITRLIF